MSSRYVWYCYREWNARYRYQGKWEMPGMSRFLKMHNKVEDGAMVSTARLYSDRHTHACAAHTVL
jgi:hypothetical protein